MKIELVTRREELEKFAEAWDALAMTDPRDGFFRTFTWYKAWIDLIRPDVEPFVIVVRDDGGQIVGLAPLCRGMYRDRVFQIEGVFWGGREVVSGDFLDFLSQPDQRNQIVDAILSFFERNPSLWRLLVLGELADRAESYQALEEMAKRCGLPYYRQEVRECPFIALPETFDQYLAGLGSSTRYHIRRRMRDMERRGARVQTYSQPEDVAEHLDALTSLHLARWRKENLPGTLGRPGFSAFLKRVCKDLPAGSACRMYQLTHEGSAIAALLTFHFGQSALYYQAGWDPDSPLAALSPAVVLMAHSIRDAIDNRLGYYEFLRGDEAYKARWTKTHRKTATLLVGRSLVARQYIRLNRVKDVVKTLRRPSQISVLPEPVDSTDLPPA